MALVSLRSSKRTRSSYTIEFKLRVLDHTENESIRKTAAHFGIDESVVRRWKANSDAIKAVHKKSRKHVKHVRLSKYPQLEEAMKSWVLSQRASAFQVSGTEILLEARRQAPDLGIQDFKGSPKWVYNFMKRNDFVRRAVTSVGQSLPPDWEEKVAKFREYVDQNKAGLETWQIGNMDEVPVTFDLPGNFTIEKKGTSDVRVMTTGNEKAKLTVVLAVLANGDKLPAYVIFRRKTLPKAKVPPNVIMSANEKSCMNSTETQLWAEKVWNKRKGSFFNKKCLLMLDAAPGHKTASTLSKFKTLATTVAMIPSGLTKKLQVLDISVNKSFKRHLRKSWETWMVNGYHQFTKSGHIKKASNDTILQWISDAWDKVPTSAIINGFKATGIDFYAENIDNADEIEVEDDSSDEENEDNEAYEKLLDIFADTHLSDVEDDE